MSALANEKQDQPRGTLKKNIYALFFMKYVTNKTDSQEHVLTSDCEANMDLKMNRDLTKDKDVCKFFKDLVKRRVEQFGC